MSVARVDPAAPLPPGERGRKLYNVRRRLARHSGFMELHAEYGNIVFFEIPEAGGFALEDRLRPAYISRRPY